MSYPLKSLRSVAVTSYGLDSNIFGPYFVILRYVLVDKTHLINHSNASNEWVRRRRLLQPELP